MKRKNIVTTLVDAVKTYYTKIKSKISSSKKASVPPYSHCLNCGTELHGMYCHKCGQYSYKTSPNIRGFIWEYLQTIYAFDSQILPTLKDLIIKPGKLTKAFLEGKRASYVHPLKLNIFFLLLILTLFLLFTDSQKYSNSIDNLTEDELIFPYIVVSSINQDTAYLHKIQHSEKDTIKLITPLSVIKENKINISPITILTDSKGEHLDTLIVSTPRILIEDQILVGTSEQGYHFSKPTDEHRNKYMIREISLIWHKILELLSTYFPIIILLTSPFLAFAIRMMYPKQRKHSIDCFVFSLHYIAFVEILMLLIFISSFITSLSTNFYKWFIILTSLIYLTTALKTVFKANSWFFTLIKAILINVIYQLICLIGAIIIFLIAIFSVII